MPAGLRRNLGVEGAEIFHACYSIYEDLSLNKILRSENSNQIKTLYLKEDVKKVFCFGVIYFYTLVRLLTFIFEFFGNASKMYLRC